MQELVREALDAALAAGAVEVEARGMVIAHEHLQARHGQPAGIESGEQQGVAVRALADGALGFAATREVDRAGVTAAARLAVANARAAGAGRAQPIALADEPAHRGLWATPRVIDPASIPLEAKLDHLCRTSEIMERESLVTVGEAAMMFRTEDQWYADSRGSEIRQTIHFAGCGSAAWSRGPGGIQKRSYPNSWAQYITGGYELIDEMDMLGHAAQTAGEAAALQSAPECPAGEFDLVIDPTQMTLQIHESVGHPLELDRVLGHEANYAGTSFATPEKLGNFAYGSELVNLTADATTPRGLATFGYDDEGVAAQKWPLVADGILRGYLTAREYAGAVGETRSRGCLRAEGWHNVPIVRMVNIHLEPGRVPLTLEELIADTKRGLFLLTNRSWSIDQRRVNFQFGCELAYEIRDGKLGRMYRNPVYWGLTPAFWGSCDAICDEREWQPWGVWNCGKGQPGQRAEMTHGSSPSRFRGVSVGTR